MFITVDNRTHSVK